MEKQAFPSPFDLHVLGAPPAFVLSQDQTLCLFYIYPDLLGPDKYLKFSPLVFQITCVRTSRTQILLSGFPLLFIFQGPFSRCLLNRVLRGSLYILSHSIRTVNPFFQNFSLFFFTGICYTI